MKEGFLDSFLTILYAISETTKLKKRTSDIRGSLN